MALFNFELNDNEEWKDVLGFEGYYQVSNLGRVRSVEMSSNGKIIKSAIRNSNTRTYASIALYKENQFYNKLVHRLVAEAFIPNPDNLPEVNHIDNNVQNNKVSNLEWVSAKQNSAHRIASKPQSFKYRRAVKCLETGEVFSSITAAGKSVSASTQQIIDSINVQGCCKAMTFVYADSLPEDEKAYMEAAHAKYQDFHRRPKMPNARKVRVVETGQEFDSYTKAAQFFSCDITTIRNRIKAAKPFNGITLENVE